MSFATCFCLGFEIPLKPFEPPPPPLHSWRVLSKPILSPLPHLRQGNKCPRPVRQQLLAQREGTFSNMTSRKMNGVLIHNFAKLGYKLGDSIPILDSGFTKLKSFSTGFSSNLGITRILPSRHTAHQSVAKIVVGSDGIGLRAANVSNTLPRLRFDKFRSTAIDFNIDC